MRNPEIFTAKKDTAGKDLPNPIVIEYANYYYSDKAPKAAEENMRAARVLSVHFAGPMLVHYRLSSTFAGESTDFDENKVGKISKGMSEAEVVAVMGTPSGRSIHPYTSDVDGTGISYYRVSMNNVTNKFHTKIFTVYFDAKKKVSDFDLKVNVK
ncbi:outer membrane protein assembly factor BamE [Massilia glaciei]|uniref:Outer membrane protein assembly factor BamE n=1 Tax=Massilia glaciei TaxID=1524097 RepID=A0A2U2HDM8_9BURK|nr:outer membrane protein assembly factor BamE [Massilia glaciei]